MGHIKEPKGVDLVVDPTPLTIEDKKRISEIIAYYKATGRKKLFQKRDKTTSLKRRKSVVAKP